MERTNSIEETFQSFQYIETVLKYSDNNMNVRNSISFDAGEVEEKERTKQILKILCNTSFVSDNDKKYTRSDYAIFFYSQKNIDLRNIKDIVENNEELRSYLLNPVLSESALLIALLLKNF